ncbi:multimeric translocon complex in the outer envelope membrane 132 [Actinidia rufa]|uniref:Multimeric translocon complex in the outer envelope membrane 132 n=1 Tax=Actinidia rufa TaxID=165716 RepID=A0A7J0D910_9ERIC|nr:multimeric translocon complex in the outer envelope membrane 132 [Actinidia rufa]
MIRVKFLRLAHRLGNTPHNVVVAQVLYRLGLAERLRGRNEGRVGAFSFDHASAMAEQLEAAGQELLDFSCTIMFLGKTGVGKSATINSIFDEVKFGTDAFELGTRRFRMLSKLSGDQGSASAPPEGPNGTATSYDMFFTQQSHVVQQAIRQAAGLMCLMNPVSLVENHSACRTNRTGQSITQWPVPPGKSFATSFTVSSVIASPIKTTTETARRAVCENVQEEKWRCSICSSSHAGFGLTCIFFILIIQLIVSVISILPTSDIPVSFSGQLTKDKEDANLQMEIASSVKHGEGKATSLGFDMHTLGKDMAYTLCSETRLSNYRRNKATMGLTATLLRDALTAGLKVEDQLIVNKRLRLVVSGDVMTGRSDVAYGGILEATLRDKDHPLGRSLSTFGLSVMDWHGDLAIGGNLQSQIPIGWHTNLVATQLRDILTFKPSFAGFSSFS